MKIYENSLNQNQYTAVKSIHTTSKPNYKGELLTKANKHILAKSNKFHITKKCEIITQIENTEIKEVAEIPANINKSVSPRSLEDLFKKFNTK